MAVTPTLFYRGTLGTTANPGATLLTTASGTTIVTSVVVVNKAGSDTTVSLALDGLYVLYNAAIAANSTITLDISQVVAASKVIAGRSAAACDMHISGVLVT